MTGFEEKRSVKGYFRDGKARDKRKAVGLLNTVGSPFEFEGVVFSSKGAGTEKAN